MLCAVSSKLNVQHTQLSLTAAATARCGHFQNGHTGAAFMHADTPRLYSVMYRLSAKDALRNALGSAGVAQVLER
jgi:hypothetical protein